MNSHQLNARHQLIIDYVTTDGPIRVEDLAERLGVSLVTVYRDLTKLEELDLISRNRGEVTPARSSQSEMPVALRAKTNTKEKNELCHALLPFIKRGGSIIVDDSSTLHPLYGMLEDHSPLTVLTNALSVVRMVGNAPGITVFMMGGRFRRWTDSFHGPATVEAIERVRSDLCIMSDAAVCGNAVCNPYDFVAETKRAMLRVSERSILVVDHTKFERRALHEVAPVSAFDTVIVDSATDDDIVARLRDEVNEVIVAPPCE
ncbi:DeoR/GlpR transcriptional regulator [Arcanobacterium haemolyticum]|nr:DeoR/GlpR transcriptional regulator [Arcanobacterium haemolyticum]